MAIGEHATHFEGKPVVDFRPGMALTPETNSYRIRRDYGDELEFADLFSQFISCENVDRVTGLLTGSYSDEMFDQADGMGSVIEAVIGAAPQLPALTGLFLGDITFEENEVSWIWQSDVSPLWTAFPRLRSLVIRGGQGLTMGNIVHDQLKSLIIQTGGLDKAVIEQIAVAKLPELEHLEIYTGDENYGGNSDINDVKAFFSGDLFPKLKYLGIKNSTYQDKIAQLAATSPILDRLEVLDLSMGVLTDEGANALLSHADRLHKLKKLDVSHHFLSNEVAEKLNALPIEVDTSDLQQADVYNDEIYRYIALAE